MSADAGSIRLAHVLPRIVLAAGAMIAALLVPLVLVPLIALGAWVALWRTGDRSAWRTAFWIGVALVVFTLGVTPVWLSLLAGLGWAEAFLLAGALAVRLVSVVFVGIAFSSIVGPVQWLAWMRRHPRVSLVVALTLRQVPELTRDAARLRAAQRGRGLLVGRQKWRPLLFLVPLLTRGVERADRLGMALVLSGWGQGLTRPVRVVSWRAGDALWTLGGLALAAFALWPGALGL